MLSRIECFHFIQVLFRLESPGGGGYGSKDKEDKEGSSPPAKKARTFLPTGSVADYVSAQESA